MSTSTDPREAIQDLLEGVSTWDAKTPSIDFYEDVAQKSKTNNTDPAIYLYKPNTDELDRFSADAESLTEDETVEIQIWILEDSRDYNAKQLARTYRDTIIQELKDYLNDNYNQTEFHNIEPSGSNDYRHQHLARKTDHYIYSVDVDTHRLI